MERRGLAGSEELWHEGPSRVVASRRRRQRKARFMGREWTQAFWRGKGVVQGGVGGSCGHAEAQREVEARRGDSGDG